MPTRRFNPSSSVRNRLLAVLPAFGRPGSRSSQLHVSPLATALTGSDMASQTTYRNLKAVDLLRFATLRWVGTCGCLILALAALGAGALPVVGNHYSSVLGGAFLAQVLPATTAVAFIGIALLVIAWVAMAPFVGVALPWLKPVEGSVSPGVLWRTAAAWMLPLAFTAPLFTQDIYSYLAQGAITRMGMDPYSAGPIDLLGVDHHLARSVPFIWAHSPSPYGPVALGLAAAVSRVSKDSILWGVFLHRLISIAMLAVAGWALLQIARRCGVNAPAAVWLGILNPLSILHLVGGIHNESIMVGLMLAGMELTFRAHDQLHRAGHLSMAVWWRWLLAGVLLACAGMVKVSAFLALGFSAAAMARELYRHWAKHPAALLAAGFTQLSCTVLSIVTVSWLTGIGYGWITGQGGAAQIRSWMSATTDVGVIAGAVGMLLELGDHTDAMLAFTRGAGLLLAGLWVLRMLWATYRGGIASIGGLGVSMFVVVLLFPVVHPWYFLWAIIPLAAWANLPFFRTAVVGYSAFVSLILLPRGLSLPPTTVLSIYLWATAGLSLTLAIGWFALKRTGLLPQR